MCCISRQLFFPFYCFESQLFNLTQGRWLWFQPTDTVTDQDNDSFQHLETVVCCYSCCIWRYFLDERSENCGAQQLFTRGILCHSFPLMWAFSLLLPFCCHFFSCVFAALHHLSVLCLLNQFAHSRRPLCLNFTPGTFHLVSKTTEWYASLSQSTLSSWMFVKQYQNNSMICSAHKSQQSIPSWHC